MNTFFGAIKSDVISHIAISKSICGNLNNLLKNLGIRILAPRLDGVVPPKFEAPPCCRGTDIWGFIDGVVVSLYGRIATLFAVFLCFPDSRGHEATARDGGV